MTGEIEEILKIINCPLDMNMCNHCGKYLTPPTQLCDECVAKILKKDDRTPHPAPAKAEPRKK